ncbi:unnamed protein product [Mycena citricolor]|uniref:Uncharacterized protein n=1 Tax=Mycena citricolor TaxID=2018698 RepID=A0AAD2GUL9_9AGAR|nr:unnamed protein product [Mycena citricolor]
MHPTRDELELVSQLFASGEPKTLDAITGTHALALFANTGLSDEVLGQIWSIADKDSNGQLSRDETGALLRLMGWAQAGVKPSPDLLEKPGPTARIPSVSIPGPSKTPAPVLPPLTPTDKAKFLKLFYSNGPVEGFVSGDRAREVMSKSKLPVEKLSRIWDLSDRTTRGALDSTSFVVAMYLIQGLMSHTLSALPDTLPDWLFDQASAVPPSPSIVISTTPSQDPFASPHDETPRSWDIPAEIRANSDRIFDSLDPLRTGFVSDSVTLPLLLESKLPPDELAKIWSQADIRGDGKLTREGFAIAQFLVRQRLGSNARTKPMPPAKPPNLVDHRRVRSASAVNALDKPVPPLPTGRLLTPTLQPAPFRYSTAPPLPARDVQAGLPRRSSFVLYPTLPTQSSDALPMRPDRAEAEAAIARLNRQLRDMQDSITQLRETAAQKTAMVTTVTQENESLRVVIEELQVQLVNNERDTHQVLNQVLGKENDALRKALNTAEKELKQLQSASSDIEMQRIQYEDLVRENERLSRQIEEMRESTTQLPWAGGDSELQTLINEDLARENARLRGVERDTRENVAQLQEAAAGFEVQRGRNADLMRDNERLQATARRVQANLDTQQQQVAQLTRELERYKSNARTPAPARAGPSREADVPPPAYEELDLNGIV